MRALTSCLVIAAGLAGLSLGLSGAATGSSIPLASHLDGGSRTSVPYGWVDFCGRRPAECEVAPLPSRAVELTADVWRLMSRVNAETNARIVPVSNLDHWGTILDHWDYPTDGKGDCKIYALEKRRLLMEAGLPRQALLMTIVRDLEGQGHAILTVVTNRGDYVLDNLAESVRPWDATGYTFLKRQAQTDPNVWLDLGGLRRAPIAGLMARPRSDAPQA